MNRKVIFERGDWPFLKFNESGDWSHHLRGVDRDNVEVVAGYFMKEGFDLYMHGSVVNRLIYGDAAVAKPHDIDLLAVGEHDLVKELLGRGKVASSGRMSLIEGFNTRYKRSEGGAYSHGLSHGRLIFSPHRQGIFRRPKEIDVDFHYSEEFQWIGV